MKRFKSATTRSVSSLAVAVLLVAVAAPALLNNKVGAFPQVTARKIQMSSSTPAATGVTYNLTFTPGTTQASTGAVIVDFCNDTPFVGATCAFDANTVPNTASASGTNVTAVSNGTPTHAVKITGLSLTSGTPITITIGGITNPATAVSFYARILTYASTANAGGYVPATTTGGATTTGTYLDYGGVALSTAASIGVTAKVMESLSFCVYLSSCGDTPSITIGHGGNTTLDSTAIDTKNVLFSLSTNAVTGAVVNLKGDTLANGGTTIAAAGSSAVTFATAQSTGKFGLSLPSGTLGAGVLANSPYDDGTGAQYALNTTNTLGTYGDTIAHTAGPVNTAVTTVKYAAVAGTTTPAGIYTTTHQLIATGTF